MSEDKNSCLFDMFNENIMNCLNGGFPGVGSAFFDKTAFSKADSFKPVYESESEAGHQERLNREEAARAAMEARAESLEIIEQKSWQFIKELNSCSRESLDACALISGKREYTYRQMFAAWERYAEVFSSLDITEANHSRVAMLGIPSPESVFSLYALNMTGASISLPYFIDFKSEESLKSLIEMENITDLILEDYQFTPEITSKILNLKANTGIRNVIILHISLCDKAWIEPGKVKQTEYNYRRLKKMPGLMFMDDLLKEYEGYPVKYALSSNDNDAFIFHTSGTTSGIHKPVPLSDRGLNDAALRLRNYEGLKSLSGKTSNTCIREFSVANVMITSLHAPLSYGGKIYLMAGSDNVQNMLRSSIVYKSNFIFIPTGLLDLMSRIPVKLDMSNIKFIFAGGSYLSVDSRKKYNEFFRKNGSEAKITVGYGLSECGGPVLISSPDREDDSIGHPFPGIRIKIYDEEEKKYYNLEDGPRTGVLFVSSPAVSSGRIDDKVFFELEEIEGDKYLNTYDLVDVGEDGAIYYVGRMNKYFVNDGGIQFDAGLVETAVSAQPLVESCGLVPYYDKGKHDTVPSLYIKVLDSDKSPEDIVTQALYNVFVRDERIKDSNMPSRCVITDDIPYNVSGKVDVHKILKDNIKGLTYEIKPVYQNDQLTEVRLVRPAVDKRGNAWMMQLVR